VYQPEETVAELRAAITVLLASSSQSMDYQKLPADKQQTLPLQDTTPLPNSISPSVDQSESLEPAIVSSSQVKRTRATSCFKHLKLPSPQVTYQKKNTEALDLTAASDSSSRPKTLNQNRHPSRQEQQHIENGVVNPVPDDSGSFS